MKILKGDSRAASERAARGHPHADQADKARQHTQRARAARHRQIFGRAPHTDADILLWSRVNNERFQLGGA